MLKNKRNREKVQQRQHQKDRDHPSTNPDVHILQHTVNIDTIPEQIPGARGTHSSQGSQGGSYSSLYSPQKTSPYQQNSSVSVHVAGSGEQLRHQGFSQLKPHELVAGSINYQSTNTHQMPTHGRGSLSSAHNKEAQMQGGSTLQASNGGTHEFSRSSYERKGHQKPHRPGKVFLMATVCTIKTI